MQDRGWAGIKNGELLRLIEAEFDVLITSDKNLRHQQNLSEINLTVMLLPSNQVPVVESLLPKIDEALDGLWEPAYIEIYSRRGNADDA